MTAAVHETLPCGLEYALSPLPQRHVVAFQIRILAGACCEPAEKLGLTRLLNETIDKGTEKRSGRELADAFDAIGAARNSGAGRETATFTCTVLPEHFERAVALHAEFLRTTTLPADVLEVNITLAKQELAALQDDAQGLVDKYISRRAFGPALGRHGLGEIETLDRITRDDVVTQWRTHFHAGRMQVTVTGPVDHGRVADTLERHFGGFGSADRTGRVPAAVEFTPGAVHYDKSLEQEQIGICWPGVDATHNDFPVQQVILGILAGGMGARLFTEVREKQGLVYWVGAWHETPRGTGMLFLGASTTPERCDRTYHALLHEMDRLGDDVTGDELERATTGILAQHQTRGDSTRARCGELANDLFFFGRPVPVEEKTAKIQRVTIEDVKRYLATNPRDRLCVVTLGPRPLDGASV